MPRLEATSPVEKRALQWCRSIHPLGLGRTDRVAELYDHLMCEIDERVSGGAPAEQAFQEAVAQMGESGKLAAEHAKLHGLAKWSVVFAALATCNARVLVEKTDAKERAVLILGVSLFFAGLMIASSVWLARWGSSETVMFVLIAIWFVPFSVLSTVQNSKGTTSCRRKRALKS